MANIQKRYYENISSGNHPEARYALWLLSKGDRGFDREFFKKTDNMITALHFHIKKKDYPKANHNIEVLDKQNKQNNISYYREEEMQQHRQAMEVPQEILSNIKKNNEASNYQNCVDLIDEFLIKLEWKYPQLEKDKFNYYVKIKLRAICEEIKAKQLDTGYDELKRLEKEVNSPQANMATVHEWINLWLDIIKGYIDSGNFNKAKDRIKELEEKKKLSEYLEGSKNLEELKNNCSSQDAKMRFEQVREKLGACQLKDAMNLALDLCSEYANIDNLLGIQQYEEVLVAIESYKSKVERAEKLAKKCEFTKALKYMEDGVPKSLSRIYDSLNLYDSWVKDLCDKAARKTQWEQRIQASLDKYEDSMANKLYRQAYRAAKNARRLLKEAMRTGLFLLSDSADQLQMVKAKVTTSRSRLVLSYLTGEFLVLWATQKLRPEHQELMKQMAENKAKQNQQSSLAKRQQRPSNPTETSSPKKDKHTNMPNRLLFFVAIFSAITLTIGLGVLERPSHKRHEKELAAASLWQQAQLAAEVSRFDEAISVADRIAEIRLLKKKDENSTGTGNIDGALLSNVAIERPVRERVSEITASGPNPTVIEEAAVVDAVAAPPPKATELNTPKGISVALNNEKSQPAITQRDNVNLQKIQREIDTLLKGGKFNEALRKIRTDLILAYESMQDLCSWKDVGKYLNSCCENYPAFETIGTLQLQNLHEILRARIEEQAVWRQTWEEVQTLGVNDDPEIIVKKLHILSSYINTNYLSFFRPVAEQRKAELRDRLIILRGRRK